MTLTTFSDLCFALSDVPPKIVILHPKTLGVETVTAASMVLPFSPVDSLRLVEADFYSQSVASCG